MTNSSGESGPRWRGHQRPAVFAILVCGYLVGCGLPPTEPEMVSQVVRGSPSEAARAADVLSSPKSEAAFAAMVDRLVADYREERIEEELHGTLLSCIARYGQKAVDGLLRRSRTAVGAERTALLSALAYAADVVSEDKYDDLVEFFETLAVNENEPLDDRAWAIRGLLRAGAERELSPILAGMLSEDSESARLLGAGMLGLLRRLDERARNALRRGLVDPSSRVRFSSAITLAQKHILSDEVFRVLARDGLDNNFSNRIDAYYALKAIGREAVGWLWEYLQRPEGSPDGKQAVLELLWDMGVLSGEAEKRAVEALRSQGSWDTVIAELRDQYGRSSK